MIDGKAPIRIFMTPLPLTVSAGTALSDARDLMAAKQIRHLPVVDSGRIVGIVSARDVLVVEDLSVFASYDTTVEAAMAANPVTVPTDTPVGHVVQTMATKDIGAVLVIDGGELKGIFTDVDAVKLLARVLS